MSRREGYALHPKAVKYLLKRSTVPGQHGRTVRKNTGQFNVQLREKQKVKRLYGLLEKQFARLMNEASRTKGQSGAALLQFLERRLDNAVYRAGFAVSRRAARQLVTHGHFMVNGRRVDVPSIRLKLGDEIQLREASKNNEYFKRLDDVSPSGNESSLSWLAVDRKKAAFKVTGLPTREEAEPEIQEQLIVEYYSR
jgi:small subunit ribosomal protein S4